MLKLHAEIRKSGQALNSLRKQGKIPAVFYGPKQESRSISLNKSEFLKVFKKAGETSVVSLITPDGEEQALIYGVDRDPVSYDIRHADFYIIEKGKKIHISIPLNFTGIAPAIKDFGGTLVKVMHELKIEAEPKDLPHSIDVDVSKLANLDSQILAKDLTLPQGVTLQAGPDEVVASVAVYKEEVEEKPLDLSSIEVEKKGKEEEAAPADAAQNEEKGGKEKSGKEEGVKKAEGK